MYRHADAIVVRAAAHPDRPDLPDWPAITGSLERDAGPRGDWLRQAWSRAWLAEAVEVASPALARQADRLAAARDSDPRELRRVTLAVARYALRMTGRATPFGLFAGVAPASIGPGVQVRWGRNHRPVLRPAAAWLSAAVTSLEACPELLARLRVVASNLAFVRDGRLIAADQQHVGGEDENSGLAAPVEVSVRHTGAVEAVMRRARLPIAVSQLAAEIAADFPRARPAAIEAMLAELVRLRLLVTSLRPPMTVTDPLHYVLARLGDARFADIPEAADRVAELVAVQDGITDHDRAMSTGERRDCRALLADHICPAQASPEWPLTVDLGIDLSLVLPDLLMREAAAAAAALTRLTPFPRGLPAWAEYHAAFMERYGADAAVAIAELVNPDTGLGFPATYQGSARTLPETPLSHRDERLLALAQEAALHGCGEVCLDDAMISRLSGAEASAVQAPAHAEIIVQVHAPSPADVERGDFELLVTGASRAAGTTTGRFLGLLGPDALKRARRAYAALPTLRLGALTAQVSCPPLHARSESVSRAPAVLPDVISVAEYPAAGGSALSVEDLAVTGDAGGLFLVSLSRQRPVEPMVLNAIAFRHFSQPIVQFLCEVSRSRAAAYMPFFWGAAECLPYLPRIRYGRTVLAPARWRVEAGDLPAAGAPWPEWKQAIVAWRRQRRVPASVHLGEADQLLRLDLSQDMHLDLLRSHLDRREHATLREAPDPGAFSWLDGRAHEIVIPLTAAPAPAVRPARSISRPVLAASHGHGHLPGSSPWLYARLYGHPARQDDILGHMPALISALDAPTCWWYVRYRDPDPHLRLRIRLPGPGAYGAAASRAGAWAARLRHLGLLGHVQLDTYYPETGRYGTGLAMTAAEDAFAADSAAGLAQLRLTSLSGSPPEAITAASLADIAAAFTGTTAQGMRWLINEVPRESTRLDRALRDTAARLADPGSDWAAMQALHGGQDVVRAWHRRRAALAAYQARLAEQREPLSVLPSLLHMHHIRVLGIDPVRERTGLALARAAALRWTAINAQASM
jgi:thiopeptide-type bacteriocin biosynthesis protein